MKPFSYLVVFSALSVSSVFSFACAAPSQVKGGVSGGTTTNAANLLGYMSDL